MQQSLLCPTKFLTLSEATEKLNIELIDVNSCGEKEMELYFTQTHYIREIFRLVQA